MDDTTPKKDLVRYLLGELPEAEADVLEVRLLADEEVSEAMQEAEYELMDRYARNQLSAAQRQRFETHYLASPLHRERAVTASHLARAADATPLHVVPQQTASAGVAWWRAMFAAPALAWSTALAFAVLSALAVWLLIERGRLLNQLQVQQQRTLNLESEIAQLRQTTDQLMARSNPTPAPTAKIEIKDGEQLLALDAQGQLRGAESYSEQAQSWLRQTLQAERLPEAPAWMDLRALHDGRDGLMGASPENSFALKQPLSQALLTATPTFRWEPLAEAESYRVDVYDSKYQRIASSEKLTQPFWQATQALTAGRVYQWQVTALRQGQEALAPAPPAPPARFAIISTHEAAAIAQARQQQPVSHLLLGALYARNGLYAEAESELLLLQKANPASSQLRQMLAEVRRRARQSAPTKTKPAQ